MYCSDDSRTAHHGKPITSAITVTIVPLMPA
jgi:hypothetical protein